MYIYHLISVFILLSSWKCDGDKPQIPNEAFASSVKPLEKSADYRSDAKLKLLNSLLQSKSMTQRARKTKLNSKLEGMKYVCMLLH